MVVPKGPRSPEDEDDEADIEDTYGASDSMDPELYVATTEGDIVRFAVAMERVPLDKHYGPAATCVQLGPQKNTVLHIATRCKHYEIVKLICNDLPFYVVEKNAKGDTPLHIAARMGDLLLVELLIGAEYRDGCVLGEKNEEGNTALHVALASCHEVVAGVLINKSRDMFYSANKEGKGVLYLAAEAGYVAQVRLLMENPAGNCSADRRGGIKSPVHAAILRKNTDVLNVLWEKDQFSFHLRFDERGRNALHYAASIDFLEGVNFLLCKFRTTLYQRDKNGLFPIHEASRRGHVRIIQKILYHCPDSRELVTLQGKNLLHIGAKSGNVKAFRGMLEMLELEKLINEVDDMGNTPLHVATICGHPEIVNCLVRDGRVKQEIQNNDGLTALDVAEENMEIMVSFGKRLTWMTLRVAGAPRSPQANAISRTRKYRMRKKSKMENNKNKINVMLLVATFVATITFSAGFTIPGGNNNSNPDQGVATMLEKLKFKEFIICNSIALYTSIIASVILIWAQLLDFSTKNFALKLAVPILGVSLVMMSIAFMAGVYLVVSNLVWLRNVVLLMGTIFLIMVLVLFMPLCFLGSSKYYMFRHMLYYPFLLVLYAFGSFNELNDVDE